MPKLAEFHIPPLPRMPGVHYGLEPCKDNAGRIVLSWYTSDRTAWNKILNAIRGLPGRTFDPLCKKWSVPASLEIINWTRESGFPQLSQAFQPLAIQKNQQGKKKELPKDDPDVIPDVNPSIQMRETIKTIELTGPVLPGLRPYQLDFLRFMIWKQGKGGLGDDMGTGKTVQSLAWLAYASVFPALIIVNAPTKLQWLGQWKKWLKSLPDGCPRIAVLSGKRPYMLDSNCSYIINWDILVDWTGTIDGNGRFTVNKPLGNLDFKCVIGDEIQAISNPKSGRSKAFRHLCKRIPGMIGMSGTPAKTCPAQFWPLLNILDEDHFGNYQKYLFRYCGPKSNGFSMTYKGASHIQELHALLAPLILRRTKAEVLPDLPPKIVEVIPLEIDEDSMASYKAEESLAFDTDGTAAELRERVTGLLHSAYALKESAAIKWVKNFMDSSEEKLCVFAWHRDVVDLLYMQFKEYCPVKIYGGMAEEARERSKTSFISSPKCRILVANIQAGGVGIDGLQTACSSCAFIEFSHTPKDHSQAEDRFHRDGACGSSVNSYYLIAPGTVDSDAIEILDSRSKMLDGVLDGKQTAETDLLTEILARHGRK